VTGVTIEGEYVPSPTPWVRDQVEAYERSGGREANTLLDTGLPIIVVTTRGNKTGQLRKTPLMRVEHSGEYALVASQGGLPRHPVWYYNLKADPEVVTIQDGPEPFDVRVREVTGDERAEWWERAVAAYPPYADYQERTERPIPVFVATRSDAAPAALSRTVRRVPATLGTAGHRPERACRPRRPETLAARAKRYCERGVRAREFVAREPRVRGTRSDARCSADE